MPSASVSMSVGSRVLDGGKLAKIQPFYGCGGLYNAEIFLLWFWWDYIALTDLMWNLGATRLMVPLKEQITAIIYCRCLSAGPSCALIASTFCSTTWLTRIGDGQWNIIIILMTSHPMPVDDLSQRVQVGVSRSGEGTETWSFSSK